MKTLERNVERVVAVSDERLDEAVRVLASAFTDYPVFTFVLPPETADRDRKLTAVMRYYAWRRLARGWPLLGVEVNGELQAVIAANPPHDGSQPAGVEAQEQHLFEVLGELAETRRRAYESASGGDFPDVPYFFIGMIGVSPEARGAGYAARLMHEIHARAQAHPLAQGVALCTESESNLAFYDRLGYAITGSAEVDGLQSWSLWRENDA
ncbi:MAG TPA: GNAT family N-acetyltransferase [Gammaproteobacteria bacterium]